jgi:two-component sensor histidine kinase
MALHELCTNAVKHGALSARAGNVEITWEADDAKVRIVWIEAGGPPVREPAQKGFGVRLLERALAQQLGGSVDLRFALKGLRCEIEIPRGEDTRASAFA